MTRSLQWVLCLALLVGCQKHIPVPDVTAPHDAETIARGKYLGTALCSCVTCHSPRDWTMQGGDNTAVLDGLGPSAVLHPPNLTAHRLGSWTDGELVRAITTGMGKGNHALVPAMPYPAYRAMALDDALAIVAWLRTLAPKAVETPSRQLPFPLELVVNVIPKPVELRPKAPRPTDADYGAYVTTIATCRWCHSEVDGRSQPVVGLEFAGGHAFSIPPPGAGTVVSANLTPDGPTGLGGWSKEAFVARFRSASLASVQAGGSNSTMMWSQFHEATDVDLEAIYDYLRTLPPKAHQVVKFPTR
jgi:cytochrome c553